MKEKKYRPTRKQLTRDEAITAVTNAKQQYFTNEECILFWRAKLGKKLDVMDLFILHTDNFTSAEEYINAMEETQQYLLDKIHDLQKRFIGTSVKDYKKCANLLL